MKTKVTKMHKRPTPVICSKKQRETNEAEEREADFPMKQTQPLQEKNIIVEINNSVDRFNT